MLPELRTPIPGPRSREGSALLERFESRNVTWLSDEFPVFWERAEGVNVWDVDGNRFLDLTSAFCVAGLGHSPAKVREAITSQCQRLWHGMGDVHPTMEKARLCEVLSQITFERWGLGAGKTILGNSGFEAVEAALKTSLLHSGKPGVITFRGAYHGLGFGAAEATGIPFFKQPFRAQLPKFSTAVPFPNCARCPFEVHAAHRLEGSPFPNCCNECLLKIEAEIEGAIQCREIGAILVEPCQGRGGEVVPPRDFLQMLRNICDTHKILLIFDEIYTGFNRTGSLFAADTFGVYPDAICLGKGLASGFPISACTARADIMDAWPVSEGEALHTSTYLGNPLGCAMALASIVEHLKPNVASSVRASSRLWLSHLRKISDPRIAGIRGIGLMLGMELVDSKGAPNRVLAGTIINAALQHGILMLAGSPEGNVLAFTPPFDFAGDEMSFVCNWLQEFLNSVPSPL